MLVTLSSQRVKYVFLVQIYVHSVAKTVLFDFVN